MMLWLRRRAILRKASELRRFVRGGPDAPAKVPECQRDRDRFLPLPAVILAAQCRLLSRFSAHLTALSKHSAELRDLLLQGPKP